MLGTSILGLFLRSAWSLFILLPYLRLGVDAYIPASPVNSTANATNGTDGASRLNLMWLGGNYGEDISYQLVGANSNGVSKVCSHFPVGLRVRRSFNESYPHILGRTGTFFRR